MLSSEWTNKTIVYVAALFFARMLQLFVCRVNKAEDSY